jgi:hypothetical protein
MSERQEKVNLLEKERERVIHTYIGRYGIESIE